MTLRHCLKLELGSSSPLTGTTSRENSQQGGHILPGGSHGLDSRGLHTSDMQRTHSAASRSSRDAHRSSRPSAEYDTPDLYQNLDDVHGEAPVKNPYEELVHRHVSREERDAITKGTASSGQITSLGTGSGQGSSSQVSHGQTTELQRRPSASGINHDVPNSHLNIAELSDLPPVQESDAAAISRHKSFEQSSSQEHQSYRRESRAEEGAQPAPETADDERKPRKVSQLATQIYTISYLILFSILGTLARLGLQALTFYPGAPIPFSSVWPNFGGSLVMGFLAEDRMLFRFEWGTPTYERHILRARQKRNDEGRGDSGSGEEEIDLAAAKRAHMATKKTIPLYIGLATGFCGSFTSFSSFVRDVFLALSNDLPTPELGTFTEARNGGHSFMALIAVIFTTISLSLSGLFIGAHLAIALEPVTPSLPPNFVRKYFDHLAVFIAWGLWLGAILLTILPPDRFTNLGASETWRGRATFSLVFAPLGCLCRFYASLHLNGRKASFPLGTFAVNILGTVVLGMAWDIAHVPVGGVIGCQVLQGIEDGFCGCLTTVSTWVGELAALRRRHAYVYGVSSVFVALALMITIMGGLRWSHGFAGLVCLK